MATILITGGTGLIGKALSRALVDKGHKVIILSRQQNTSGTKGNPSYAHWDIEQQTIDKEAVASSDHIIHLAGAGVADKRWTNKRKKEIVESRVKSSELLIKALKEIPNNVRAVVSASAIGWYGADPVIPNPRPFTEEDKADDGFLGQTCVQWERSIEPVRQAGKRLVKLRTGIVLSKEGGALEEFSKPLKFGMATILGSGNQIISWIHIDDLVRLYIKSIDDEKMDGVFNAVAPKPVSNKELILQLAKEIKGKFYIPLHVPSFALKMVMGEMSIEVLKSATVSCTKVQLADFTFVYPTVEASIASLRSQ
jgi:uncharacterized protein (TIGR01777 family)